MDDIINKLAAYEDNGFSFHHHCKTEFEWQQDRAAIINAMMKEEVKFVSSSNGHITVFMQDHMHIDFVTLIRPDPFKQVKNG